MLLIRSGLQVIGDMIFDLDVLADPPPEQAKLLKAVTEFDTYTYIRANTHPQLRRALPGRRGHLQLVRGVSGQSGGQQAHGESSRCAGRPAVRTCSSRFRTRVLNDDLADDFRRWHPGFTHAEPDRELAAAA